MLTITLVHFMKWLRIIFSTNLIVLRNNYIGKNTINYIACVPLMLKSHAWMDEQGIPWMCLLTSEKGNSISVVVLNGFKNNQDLFRKIHRVNSSIRKDDFLPVVSPLDHSTWLKDRAEMEHIRWCSHKKKQKTKNLPDWITSKQVCSIIELPTT